jgi:hypothetical protein
MLEEKIVLNVSHEAFRFFGFLPTRPLISGVQQIEGISPDFFWLIS